MNEVIKMLEKAKRERLWGNLQIDFRDGEAVLVRRTETTKISGMKTTRHDESLDR